MSSSPLYLDAVVTPLVRGTTVLDAGCGVGRWGCLLRANYWEAGMASPPTIDGFDAFTPNVLTTQELGVYRSVWQHVLPTPLTGNWHTVLACEVLEHLEEQDVDLALDVLEGAATHRIIISTPNGPAFRGGDGVNEYEAHRSYVPRSKLRKRGYRILGAGFGPPSSRLAWIEARVPIGRDLASLSLHLPALAAACVAYKDVASPAGQSGAA